MRLVVIGAGGHAKVVVDAARAAGIDVLAAVGDPAGARTVLGVPVVATLEEVEADGFIAAIGDNRARAEAFDAARRRGLTPVTVIHPSAAVAPSATIGSGTFVAAGVVVNPEACIGQNAILNTSCSVDHDCAIGDHVHVAPGVRLCGGAKVGPGALLGVGSAVIPGVSIGAWAVVGAGAAVLEDVPDGATFAGVPARDLHPEEPR
ncbi:MAG: acetyltransferase [Coriobacteriia bacterium]|nr:acetyltransferase [Coriobacteriia bacterium]